MNRSRNWLKEVYTSKDETTVHNIVVYIPNVRHHEGRSTKRIDWEAVVPSISRSIKKVLVFEHDISIEDCFNKLLEASPKLFATLFYDYLPAQQNGDRLSVVLVGHGLGGILLKQAIAATADHSRRWRDHLSLVSGFIFLGTPHVTKLDYRTSDKLSTLLRPKLTKQNASKFCDSATLNELYISASQFIRVIRQMASNPLMLSGYETRVTKLQGSSIFRFPVSAVLVDKFFAETGFANETLEAIDVDLDDVFNPRISSSFRVQFAELIEKFAADVVKQNDQSKPRPIGSSSICPSMSDASSTSHFVEVPKRSSLGSSFREIDEATSPSSKASSPEGNGIHGQEYEIASLLPVRYPRDCLTRTGYFQPREDTLKEISKTLIHPHAKGDSSRKALSCVITGLGGVGKTELAREFLIRRQSEFDVILFFVADHASRLFDQFSEAAIKLGLVSPERSKEVDYNTHVLKSWLENPLRQQRSSEYVIPGSPDNSSRYVKWALVLDNASDSETLFKFWPRRGYGSVLVTSRDPFNRSPSFSPTAGLHLDGLPVPDAADLLSHLSGFKSENSSEIDAANSIVKQLVCLPLALEQVAAVICKKNVSFSAFLRLCDHKSFWYWFYDRPVSLIYGESLASNWAFNDLGTSVLDLLYVISMLDPVRVQEELLLAMLNSRAESSFPSTDSEYHEALSALIESSLVRKSATNGEINVHRLVQDVARSRMVKEKGKSDTMFHIVLHGVSEAWFQKGGLQTYTTGTSSKIDRWEVCREMYSHVVKLSEVYKELLEDHDSIEPPLDFAKLLCDATWYRYERGEGPEAEHLLNLATQICEHSSKECTLIWRRIYGCRLGIAGTVCDAKTFFQYGQLRLQMAEDELQSTGKLSSFLATAYCEMGQAYSMNRLPDQAFYYLEKSCQIRQDLPGFQKDWLFNPFYHMGLARSLQGNPDRAADLLVQAVNERIEVLGPNDRDSARTGALYYVLGNVRNQQGLSDDAFGQHQKALLHCRQTTGETSLQALRCEYKVAEHHVRYGYDKQAKEQLLLIINICGQRKSRDREIARASFLLSEIYGREGKHKDQRSMAEKTVQIFNKTYPETPRTVDSLTQEDVESLVYYDFI